MNRENKNTKGRNKHTGLKIGVVVAVIVIIILLLLHFCKGCSGPASGNGAEGRTFDLTRPGDAVSDRGPETRSREEIQADLNRQVAEGQITISMNLEPRFESAEAEGDLLIVNDTSNRYPQIIEIIREDNGETVYTSPVVPVGKYINTDKLDAPLSAGDYPCIAYFHAINAESGAVLGTGAARITVHILH